MPPLAQAQTALGKPEYVLWNVGICPVPTFCEQLLPTQNFTGIGQSAKTIFNMADVCHLAFLKFSY